jgi:CRP-like cAMP-binding protein
MAKEDWSPSVSPEQISVEDLCLLANAFADGKMYDRAVQIYESACRLYPENLALKINLGRIRNMRNQALENPGDILPDKSPVGQAGDRDVWANRYQGLGEIFLRMGKRNEAEKIFELSRVSNPNFFLPYLNLGRIHLESGDLGRALRELETANRLNPFSEETADLLAAAHFQNREYMDALKFAIDGLILSGEIQRAEGGRYRSKIKSIMERLPDFTPPMRNQMIRERSARISSLYEDLGAEVGALNPSGNGSGAPAGVAPSPPVQDAAIAKDEEQRAYGTAVALKRHLIFRNMDEAAVLKVARFTSEKHVPAGDPVYHEGDPVYGLYMIGRGRIELQKSTPSGPMVFATFERGSFFGDDNLLYGRDRFTSAVATQDSDLLFVDKAGLATIFAREKEIAIHFLWYFWKSLSFQIRQSNDRMTGFFAGSPDRVRREVFQASIGGRPTHIEIDKKLEVLQSQGLTANELHLLARFSNEEVYNRGETIFREGDVGDRLYIVLTGSVLISKYIPGAGEETLATLKRGDFFGEMALIGNDHRRSADARAQEQNTTVLVVTNHALREILSIDTDSAYQLLRILVRILSRRLLEINEKLYQWRLMSGGFQ